MHWARPVAVGDQRTGGIDHPAATVGGVALAEEPVAFAFCGQTERLDEPLAGTNDISRQLDVKP